MKQFALSSLVLALALAAGTAGAAPIEAVSHAYYNSNGVIVGTRTTSCDGTETISGEETADDVETGSQFCGGADNSTVQTDPEVLNGPHP